MTEASKKFQLEMSPSASEFTSLQALEDGNLPCSLPGGETSPSGPGAVHVSRFRARDSEKAMPTNDTSGPLFTASSPSASLQRCLASKLQARMAENGSPLYALIWSDWDMPAGVPICRLRASALRTSDSGCGGWPTPMAGSPKTETYNEAGDTCNGRKTRLLASGWPTPQAAFHGGDRNFHERNKKLAAKPGSHGKSGMRVEDAAELVGWPSPQASSGGPEPEGKTGRKLSTVAGWATPHRPRDRDTDATAFRWNPNRNQDDPAMQLLGREANLSDVPTEKARPVEPGIFPLAHGVSGRLGQLRAYGNAIVPPLAAEFVAAFMECRP